MAGCDKDRLRQQFQAAQRDALVRDGKGARQDFTFVSAEEIAELAQFNQRLAADHEPAQTVYLDDKRFVRVCAISAEGPQAEMTQTAAAYADKPSGQAQNPVPATTPRRRLEAVPMQARA